MDQHLYSQHQIADFEVSVWFGIQSMLAEIDAEGPAKKVAQGG